MGRRLAQAKVDTDFLETGVSRQIHIYVQGRSRRRVHSIQFPEYPGTFLRETLNEFCFLGVQGSKDNELTWRPHLNAENSPCRAPQFRDNCTSAPRDFYQIVFFVVHRNITAQA